MLLKCHTPFGNFVPGDKVEVPDDAAFDGAHFEQAEPDAAKAPGKGEGK